MFANSKEFIKYIISKDGYNNLMREASHLHYKVFKAMAYFLVYIFFSSLLNYFGGGWLNVYKAILINLLILFHSTKPELMSAVAATSPLVNKKKENGESKSLLDRIRILSENGLEAAKVYAYIVSHLLLIASVTDLALSIIPIKYNPNIVGYIILCGMIVVYADIKWEWKTRTFEKATYWLIVIAVVLNVALLVPESLYRYLFDWAPSDITIEKIEKTGEKGVLIKGIKSVYKAAENAAEKAKLEAEIARLKAAALSSNEKPTGTTSMTWKKLCELPPYKGEGIGRTMLTAEFGRDYSRGDVLITKGSKNYLVWVDGEGGGWKKPNKNGEYRVTTLTHGTGNVPMQIPKNEMASIEVWRYLPN